MFNDLTYDFKIIRTYNLYPYFYLRKNFVSKIEYFTIEGHKFTQISEMTSTLITNFNNITYEYYLKWPKPMLEWRLYEKLAGNAKLITAFELFHIH